MIGRSGMSENMKMNEKENKNKHKFDGVIFIYISAEIYKSKMEDSNIGISDGQDIRLVSRRRQEGSV